MIYVIKNSTFFIDYFYDGFRGHSQGKHAGKWNEKKVCKIDNLTSVLHLYNAVSLLQKTRVSGMPSMSVELKFTQKTIEKQCSWMQKCTLCEPPLMVFFCILELDCISPHSLPLLLGGETSCLCYWHNSCRWISARCPALFLKDWSALQAQ